MPFVHKHKSIDYYVKTLELLAKREKELPLRTYRKHIIDTQNRINYQNEYDRIRGYLSNRSVLPAGTVESLEKRKRFLKSLGIGDENHLK